MSKPRKNRPTSSNPPATQEPAAAPASAPASAPPARDPDEFELDEHDERSQPKLRIPEQRREQPMFEVAGQRSHRPADAREQAPAPNFEGRVDTVWKPASEEDISGYNPAFESAPVPPTVQAKASAPAPARRTQMDEDLDELPERAPAVPNEPSGGLDELDEFLAKTAQSGPEAPVRRERRPFTVVEWACLGGGGAVLVGLLIWLFGALTNAPGSAKRRSDPVADVPLEGELVTVEDVTSGWRARKDTDRVARMEVFLPKPGEIMPALVPQVDFTISGSSKSGFLRFIFKDSEGKARGDTRVVRVDGGKLVSLNNGEIITGATTGTVYASNGLQDTATFNSYASSADPRWSVEVSESPSYDAKDIEWKFLAQFDIRNSMIK